jgi:TusA-related sulfurtransferase
MKIDEILKMVSTDPGSVSDVTAWTGKTGHQLLGHEEVDSRHVFTIKKTK